MNEPAPTPPDHALELGFQIGELLIDPQDGQVSGRSGLQKLDPKVMDVLVMLARHAGHVVLREDLLARGTRARATGRRAVALDPELAVGHARIKGAQRGRLKGDATLWIKGDATL